MSNTETAVTGTVSGARKRWNATDLGLIAVFAALVAGSALVPGLLDIIGGRTRIPSALVNPFEHMLMGAQVREQQLRQEGAAYLVACGLAMRRFG